MEKNLKVSTLLDFYTALLTENQRQVLNLYYNEDFSLSEIAQNLKITRQGVHDTIKKAEGQLLVMAKDLRAHVIFHAGSHHMSVVGNKVIAVKFQNHQKEHEDDKGQNGMKGRLCIPVNYMGGDIAHDQRDDQGYGSGNSCKKHI